MLKKGLALLITLAMVLSMGALTAFAEGDAPANEKEITGDGDTTYVETDVFAVLLPTNSKWDFTLDPQGLIGAYADEDAGEYTEITDEELEEFAGKILPGEDVPLVVNKSSYKVTLGVSIKVTGDAVAVANEAAVEADTANNILLNAILSKESVNEDGTEFVSAGDDAVEVPLSATAQTLGFVLDAPVYEYKTTDGQSFTYGLKEDEKGFGTQIQLGGVLNKTADWKDFANGTKSVGVSAKFTLVKAGEAELTLAESADPNAYGYIGLLSGSIGGDKTGFIDGTSFLTEATKSGNHTKTQNLTIPFHLKDGDEITKVVWNTGTTEIPKNTGWTYASDVFTLKSYTGGSLVGTTAGAKYITIFVGSTEYKYNFTVN